MEVLVWIEENWVTLLTGSGLAALVAIITNYFVRKVVPALLVRITVMFAKIITNLFGSKYGDEASVVSELPIIGEFKQLVVGYSNEVQTKATEFQANMIIDYELRLLDLKQKLSSPLYSAVEKLPLQAAFNYIYQKIKDQLSPEIIHALEMFENITQV